MEREHTTGQAEDTPVGLPIIELGGSLLTLGLLRADRTEIHNELVNHEISEMKKTLSYINDVKIVDDFHMVQGPMTDVLSRWKQIGWYGRIESMGYHRLKTHFACKHEHVPDTITLEFINSMILRLAQQDNDYDENYDD